MRSSTFSSNHPTIFYAKLLVGICAILVVAFELLSCYLLKHNSEPYARVSRQYAEAVKIHPAKPGEPTSVLMVGNSLLLEAVDTECLKELTSGHMQICPVLLEATDYYDCPESLGCAFLSLMECLGCSDKGAGILTKYIF